MGNGKDMRSGRGDLGNVVKLVHDSLQFQALLEREPTLRELQGRALYHTAGELIQRDLSGMRDTNSPEYHKLTILRGWVQLVAADTPDVATKVVQPESIDTGWYIGEDNSGRMLKLPHHPYL